MLLAEARAQEPLSLKDAVKIGLLGNKSVAASAASKDAAASRIPQARSGFLPKVNYLESWTGSDNPVFVFSSLLNQRQFGEANFQIGSLNHPDFLNNFQSLITADQPLYDAGKASRATHSAELTRDLASEDERRAQMEVIADVVRSYCDAQLSADELDAARQAMRSVQSDLERAESRRSAGMATDVDVLSIRVHLASVGEEQIRRSADLDVARASLNYTLGLPLDASHTLTTSMNPLPILEGALADYEKTAGATRPEAHQAKIAKEIAEIDAAGARRNFLPEASFHAAFEADGQRFYDRGGSSWLVSIGLRWNLFNGFADKARVVESQSALRRSSAEQERTDSAIQLQVRRAWAELRAAVQRIETARAAEAEAEESLRISQNRYGAGLNTVTDLLHAETARLETRTRYLAAVHDQRIAAAMLEMAAGTLNADSEVLN